MQTIEELLGSHMTDGIRMLLHGKHIVVTDSEPAAKLMQEAQDNYEALVAQYGPHSDYALKARQHLTDVVLKTGLEESTANRDRPMDSDDIEIARMEEEYKEASTEVNGYGGPTSVRALRLKAELHAKKQEVDKKRSGDKRFLEERLKEKYKEVCNIKGISSVEAISIKTQIEDIKKEDTPKVFDVSGSV